MRLELTPDNWRESLETALIGPIEIMRHYIPGMKDKGWGRIVNIATFSAKNSSSRFIVGQNIVIDGGQHHSLF